MIITSWSDAKTGTVGPADCVVAGDGSLLEGGGAQGDIGVVQEHGGGS